MQIGNKTDFTTAMVYQGSKNVTRGSSFAETKGFGMQRDEEDNTSYPIGAEKYTEKEWDEFLERFDASQEVIRELMRERHKRQQEQREEQKRINEEIEKKLLEKKLLEKEWLEEEALRTEVDKLFWEREEK